MNVFFDLVASLLAAVYSVWNNYAWAITGLTLLIMVAVTPLTLKGTRSMMMMQQLMPEQKKLQARYKDDRQKYNEELLKFYRENNISPLGGCLPLMVQMPIFIVLYAVLRGLTRRTSPLGFNVGFTGGQLGQALHLTIPPTPVVPPSGPHCTTPIATPGACFDPSYLRHSTTLYQNLSHTNVMQAMGMNLAESASTALKAGVVHSLPYFLLIAVVAVTGWVQQKQIQGRTPANSVPQQQQALMKVMPFFLPVISFGLPAGLVLYFAVSNLYRVGQQWFIGRSIYGPVTGAAGGGAKPPSGGSGGTGGGGRNKPSGGSGGTGGGGRNKPSGGSGRDGGDSAESAGKPTTGSGGPRPRAKRTSSPAEPSDARANRPAKPTKRTGSSSGGGDAASKAAPASGGPGGGGSSGGGRSSGGKGNGADDTRPTKPILQPRARKNRKG
ncbi:MAG TPA: YidC/Oxa1 family membrane protein insertase [Acidimicrobiales bacterium]|nr:YidC/Oxa1 family membrane protein insertase [Acidimicrobiales bacterium]